MTAIATTVRLQVTPGSIERCLDAIGTSVRAVEQNETIDGVRFEDMRLVAACGGGVGSSDDRKEP